MGAMHLSTLISLSVDSVPSKPKLERAGLNYPTLRNRITLICGK